MQPQSSLDRDLRHCFQDDQRVQEESIRSVPTNSKYYITYQNDLYQTSEWIEFVLPWSIGYTLLVLAQFWATAMCVLGAIVGWLVTWAEERLHPAEASPIGLIENNDES